MKMSGDGVLLLFYLPFSWRCELLCFFSFLYNFPSAVSFSSF